MSELIPLTRGKYATVDESDYESLTRYKWQALELYPGNFYAGRTVMRGATKTTVYMARQIMGYPAGSVDHINGEELDNRRSNLRIVTTQQNSCNRGPNRPRRLKGVFWHTQAKKWRAMIRVNGKLKSLGLYSSPEDAARVYDKASREYHGEFGYINFPVEGKKSLPNVVAEVNQLEF